MKNKLQDLKNALFVELETLQDEDTYANEDGKYDEQKAAHAFKRSEAVASVAEQIIATDNLLLSAAKIAMNSGTSAIDVADVLGINSTPLQIGQKKSSLIGIASIGGR